MAVTRLVDKYHDGDAPRGRRHRLVVALHPVLKPAKDPTQTPSGKEQDND